MDGAELTLAQRQVVRALRLLVRRYDLICIDELFENVGWELFNRLREAVINYQEGAIFVEVSSNNRYIYPGSRRVELGGS